MSALLDGRRILVTRPAAQAETLVQQIGAQGGEPVLFPLIEIGPADDLAPLLQTVPRLAAYAMVIFISPNAVDFSLPSILARRIWPADVAVAAIGQSTVSRLAIFGLGDVIVPSERFDSEALLELPPFAAERVAGKKVLILRGNGGRDLLRDTLTARGARVDCVTCYHRSAPTDGALLVSLLRNNALDALTVSSSEGLHNLMALLDTESQDRLLALPVFVPHQRIAEAAQALGFKTVVLTGPADAGIMAGLGAYRWSSRE